MADTTNRWWPSSLMALAGILFMVASFWGNAAVWIPIGVVFLIIAAAKARRPA